MQNFFFVDITRNNKRFIEAHNQDEMRPTLQKVLFLNEDDPKKGVIRPNY